MPDKPPTFREKYLGGRAETDRLYNRARNDRPEERAIRSRRWQAVRILKLRMNPVCERCIAEGKGLASARAADVHHIVPRRIAPERTFDLDNLQSVCRQCHAELDAQERRR